MGESPCKGPPLLPPSAMAVKMVIYILYQSVYEIIILIFKQTEYLPGPMIALYLPCLFVSWSATNRVYCHC